VSFWLPLPVAGRTQDQNNRVCYFNHRLQGRGHHDEEDDAEEEGALQRLHVQQARLKSEQKQSDALRHTSEEEEG